jgi:uncharacterized paraquat-inducible protein A
MAFVLEHPARFARRLVDHVGKWGMLDVMVLALLVLTVKALPGDSELALRWGVWAFGGSVLLGLIASVIIPKTAVAVESKTEAK